MDFSRDGRIVATGGTHGTVELWDSGTGEPIGQPMKGDRCVTSIAFSRDGHLLAAGYADYTLRLWDTGTFEPVGDRMRLDSIARPWRSVPTAHARVGRRRRHHPAVGCRRPIPTRGAAHRSPGSVMSLDFSSDGTKLLSAS